MQPIVKIVVAVLVVALIAVIGLIVFNNPGKDNGTGAGEPAAVATTTPEGTAENTQEPGVPAQDDAAAAGADEALSDEGEAQGTMYEGALAGLTEEEIAAMAISEEESSARRDESGAEGAVD